MARCENCALNEMCPEVGASGPCDAYINRNRIMKNTGEKCMVCEHFCADACTCALDPEGEVLSIHYCCDRFKRR